jgi:hypothetical protein
MRLISLKFFYTFFTDPFTQLLQQTTMNPFFQITISLVACILMAACGGGGSSTASDQSNSANTPAATVPQSTATTATAAPPAATPSNTLPPTSPTSSVQPPVTTSMADCIGNTDLLADGNSYEIEFLGSAKTGSGLSKQRYLLKSSVLGNKTFQSKNAIETRNETIYLDVLTGLPSTGTALSISTYSQIQGTDALTLGSSIQVAQSGQSVNYLTSYSPAIRSPLNWSAAQTLTQTYTASMESVGLPVVTPPAVSQMSVVTRYIGRETITVAAGTFEACRFEMITNGMTSSNWVAATGRYAGLSLKSQDLSTGSSVEAMKLLFNGR